MLGSKRESIYKRNLPLASCFARSTEVELQLSWSCWLPRSIQTVSQSWVTSKCALVFVQSAQRVQQDSWERSRAGSTSKAGCIVQLESSTRGQWRRISIRNCPQHWLRSNALTHISRQDTGIQNCDSEEARAYWGASLAEAIASMRL